MAKKSLSLWARERLSKTLWSSPWKEKTRWFEEFHFHRKYPLNAVLHISKNVVTLHGGIIFLILKQEYEV